jgi:hypothetical protein
MGLIARVRRPVDLFSLIGKANKRADKGHTLRAPRCAHCRVTEYDEGGLPVERQKYVDEVQLVEWGGTHARVRGKCHGKEEVLEVKFPYALDTDENEDDLVLWRSLWRSLVFFDTELTR